MVRIILWAIVLVGTMILTSPVVGVSAGMTAQRPILPKMIGAWSRPDSPRLIVPANIFKYMDGAGELYLGYRFQRLEVYEYRGRGAAKILVELYYLETPADAFGLLSLDWGGQPVALDHPGPIKPEAFSLAHPPGALYGKGLLRLRVGRIYARVLASRETPAAKRAVLALGRAITAGRKPGPVPDLVRKPPPNIGPDWRLRPDRVSFFRSYLVLNNAYYLSHHNILNINHSVECVLAPYERTRGERRSRIQFLMVKYADKADARQALRRFHDAYLREHRGRFSAAAAGGPACFKIEDGWLAYGLKDRYVLIVFQSPDPETARELIRKTGSRLP